MFQQNQSYIKVDRVCVFSEQCLHQISEHSLPINKISIENFKLLYFIEEYPATAYFFLFSLFIEAINSWVLSIDERVEFIEISAHYLSFYQKILNLSTNRFPQKCKKNATCCMFNASLIEDFLTTLVTLDSFINSFQGEQIHSDIILACTG